MNSTNSEQISNNADLEGPKETSAIGGEAPKGSATTPDEPNFGWSAYAERVNGRFAMVGFTAILLIEAFSQNSFLQWAGILK